WTFDRGRLGTSQPALGEAEYELAGEATGAINSVLFDTDRTAASFFANPYSLLPEPAGKGFIPRFTDDTGIAVTNPSEREISLTYVARRFGGPLVSGSGIENPSPTASRRGGSTWPIRARSFRRRRARRCGPS